MKKQDSLDFLNSCMESLGRLSEQEKDAMKSIFSKEHGTSADTDGFKLCIPTSSWCSSFHDSGMGVQKRNNIDSTFYSKYDFQDDKHASDNLSNAA